MPYSPKAHRLFEAAAHDKTIAKEHGLSQATAARLAHEGIKKGPPPPKVKPSGHGMINKR
jgi:hypothetical protein